MLSHGPRTKFIQGDPHFGKTETLVFWAQERPGRVIVVRDAPERDRLMKNYGLFPEQVAVYRDLLTRADRTDLRRTYAIDNLDAILGQVFNGVTIEAATITEPVVVLLDQKTVGQADLEVIEP